MTENTQKKPDNPIWDVLFNIILPVLVLKYVSPTMGANGPFLALIIGLSLPLGYGIWDYKSKGKRNYISMFGFVNVLLTGGFALASLEGIWFAVKETAFPAVIGLGVAASAYTKKPVIKAMACNPNVMDMAKIEASLKESNRQEEFSNLLKLSTLFLAISFFISAVLNYVLAKSIFITIAAEATELQRTQILNEQIAEMTWKGYVVIALPLMIFMIGILVHLFRGITKITGVAFQELFLSTK